MNCTVHTTYLINYILHYEQSMKMLKGVAMCIKPSRMPSRLKKKKPGERTRLSCDALEDRALLSVSPSGVLISSAVEGMPFTGLAATFTANDPAPQSAGNYLVTIDWGDGHSSNGQVQPNPAVSGQFDVIGANTYTSAGNYPVSIRVNDLVDQTFGTANSQAQVVDAPLPASGALITPGKGTLFMGRVASFSDYDPNHQLNFYSATIDWGDGSTTNGTVQDFNQGGY